MKIYLVMRKTEDAGFVVEKAFQREDNAYEYIKYQLKINKEKSLGKLIVMGITTED